MKRLQRWFAFFTPRVALSVAALACHPGSLFRASAQEPETKSEVVERGAHHKVIRNITRAQLDDGSWQSETNSYVELASGMHRLNSTGAWVDASTELVFLSNRWRTTNAVHQVSIASNCNTEGAISLVMPDGKTLNSHVLGISFYDAASGDSVMLAQITNAIATYHPQSGQIIFSNALDTIRADIRYQISRKGLEQDVIIREQLPSPSEYGLDPASTRLEVITEFLSPPAPQIHARGMKTNSPTAAKVWQEPVLTDDGLDFESMKIGPGQAFLTGKASGGGNTAMVEHPRLEVAKRWMRMSGRQVLVEAVEYPTVTNILKELPQPSAGGAGLTPRRVSRRILAQSGMRSLPEAPARQRHGEQVQTGESDRREVATTSTASSSPGLVIDYDLTLAGYSSYTFYADTNYRVTSTVTLSGTTTFQGGTVIKLTDLPGVKMTVQGPIVCDTGPYRPVIITSDRDHSVGQKIGATSHIGTGANVNGIGIEWSPGNNAPNTPLVLSHFRFAHLAEAIRFIGGSDYTEHRLKHIQLVRCKNGLTVSSGVKNIRCLNILASGVESLMNFQGGSARVRFEHLSARNVTAFFTGTAGFIAPELSFFNTVIDSTTCGGLPVGAREEAVTKGPVFINAFAGSCYLPEGMVDKGQVNFDNSPATTLDSELVTELQTMTVTAPTVLIAQACGTIPAIGRTVARDGNIGAAGTWLPDLGYHYPALDYVIKEATASGCSITIGNGAAVAFAGTHGIAIAGPTTITVNAHPLLRNQLTRYQSVQEQSDSLFDSAAATPNTVTTSFKMFPFTVAGGSLSIKFTEINLPADSSSKRAVGELDTVGFNGFAIRDCRIRGASISYYGVNAVSQTVTLINSILEGCNISFNRYGTPYNSPLAFVVANNLIRNGAFAINFTDSTTPPSPTWDVSDNLFVGVTPSGTFYSSSVVASYNAFSGGSAPMWSSNNRTVTTLDFVPGQLGEFYYPETGTGLAQLRDADVSRSAADRSLGAHTTSALQTREESGILDIGFHYISTSWDSDGDRVLDYMDPDSLRPGLYVGSAINYTDGAVPVKLATSGWLRDGSVPNMNGSTLTVSVVNRRSTEVVDLPTTGTTKMTGSSVFVNTTTQVGTCSTGPQGEFTVVFNAAAQASHVTTVLRAIQYRGSQLCPPRTVTFSYINSYSRQISAMKTVNVTGLGTSIPPVLSFINAADQNDLWKRLPRNGTPLIIPIRVNDADSNLEDITFAITTVNLAPSSPTPLLLPSSAVSIQGTGTDRKLVIDSQGSTAGFMKVTVTASDCRTSGNPLNIQLFRGSPLSMDRNRLELPTPTSTSSVYQPFASADLNPGWTDPAVVPILVSPNKRTKLFIVADLPMVLALPDSGFGLTAPPSIDYPVAGKVRLTAEFASSSTPVKVRDAIRAVRVSYPESVATANSVHVDLSLLYDEGGASIEETKEVRLIPANQPPRVTLRGLANEERVMAATTGAWNLNPIALRANVAEPTEAAIAALSAGSQRLSKSVHFEVFTDGLAPGNVTIRKVIPLIGGVADVTFTETELLGSNVIPSGSFRVFRVRASADDGASMGYDELDLYIYAPGGLAPRVAIQPIPAVKPGTTNTFQADLLATTAAPTWSVTGPNGGTVSLGSNATKPFKSLEFTPTETGSYTVTCTSGSVSDIAILYVCDQPSIPKDIVFVVDGSGSMLNSGGLGFTRFEEAKSILNKALNSLDSNLHQAALVVFNNGAQTYADLGTSFQVINFSMRMSEDPQEEMPTHLGSALAQALELLNNSSRPSAERAIFVITDGIPSDAVYAHNQAAIARSLGIRIVSMVIPGGDPSRMRELVTRPVDAVYTDFTKAPEVALRLLAGVCDTSNTAPTALLKYFDTIYKAVPHDFQAIANDDNLPKDSTSKYVGLKYSWTVPLGVVIDKPTESNVRLLFPSPGNFDVTVTVSENIVGGLAISKTRRVTVLDRQPNQLPKRIQQRVEYTILGDSGCPPNPAGNAQQPGSFVGGLGSAGSTSTTGTSAGGTSSSGGTTTSSSLFSTSSSSATGAELGGLGPWSPPFNLPPTWVRHSSQGWRRPCYTIISPPCDPITPYLDSPACWTCRSTGHVSDGLASVLAPPPCDICGPTGILRCWERGPIDESQTGNLAYWVFTDIVMAPLRCELGGAGAPPYEAPTNPLDDAVPGTGMWERPSTKYHYEILPGEDCSSTRVVLTKYETELVPVPQWNVFAGPDRIVNDVNTFQDIEGDVTDLWNPPVSAPPVLTWSVLEWPGASGTSVSNPCSPNASTAGTGVTFEAPSGQSSQKARVKFANKGRYKLRLTANGPNQTCSYDDMEVLVGISVLSIQTPLDPIPLNPGTTPMAYKAKAQFTLKHQDGDTPSNTAQTTWSFLSAPANATPVPVGTTGSSVTLYFTEIGVYEIVAISERGIARRKIAINDAPKIQRLDDQPILDLQGSGGFPMLSVTDDGFPSVEADPTKPTTGLRHLRFKWRSTTMPDLKFSDPNARFPRIFIPRGLPLSEDGPVVTLEVSDGQLTTSFDFFKADIADNRGSGPTMMQFVMRPGGDSLRISMNLLGAGSRITSIYSQNLLLGTATIQKEGSELIYRRPEGAPCASKDTINLQVALSGGAQVDVAFEIFFPDFNAASDFRVQRIDDQGNATSADHESLPTLSSELLVTSGFLKPGSLPNVVVNRSSCTASTPGLLYNLVSLQPAASTPAGLTITSVINSSDPTEIAFSVKRASSSTPPGSYRLLAGLQLETGHIVNWPINVFVPGNGIVQLASETAFDAIRTVRAGEILRLSPDIALLAGDSVTWTPDAGTPVYWIDSQNIPNPRAIFLRSGLFKVTLNVTRAVVTYPQKYLFDVQQSDIAANRIGRSFSLPLTESGDPPPADTYRIDLLAADPPTMAIHCKLAPNSATIGTPISVALPQDQQLEINSVTPGACVLKVSVPAVNPSKSWIFTVRFAPEGDPSVADSEPDLDPEQLTLYDLEVPKDSGGTKPIPTSSDLSQPTLIRDRVLHSVFGASSITSNRSYELRLESLSDDRAYSFTTGSAIDQSVRNPIPVGSGNSRFKLGDLDFSNIPDGDYRVAFYTYETSNPSTQYYEAAAFVYLRVRIPKFVGKLEFARTDFELGSGAVKIDRYYSSQETSGLGGANSKTSSLGRGWRLSTPRVSLALLEKRVPSNSGSITVRSSRASRDLIVTQDADPTGIRYYYSGDTPAPQWDSSEGVGVVLPLEGEVGGTFEAGDDTPDPNDPDNRVGRYTYALAQRAVQFSQPPMNQFDFAGFRWISPGGARYIFTRGDGIDRESGGTPTNWYDDALYPSAPSLSHIELADGSALMLESSIQSSPSRQVLKISHYPTVEGLVKRTELPSRVIKCLFFPANDLVLPNRIEKIVQDGVSGDLVNYLYNQTPNEQTTGNLVRVDRAGGRYETYEYDSAKPHLLTKIRNEANQIVLQAEYDAAGELKLSTDETSVARSVRVPGSPASPDLIETLYTPMGNRTVAKYIQQKSAESNLSLYDWVINGANSHYVKTELMEKSHDGLPKTTRITTPTQTATILTGSAGSSVTLTIPSLVKVIERQFDDPDPSGENAPGPNAGKRLLSERVYYVANPETTFTTTYAYGSGEHPIETVRPDGSASHVEYNAAGQPFTQGPGRRGEFKGLDSFTQYDENGQVAYSVDPNGMATTYYYDAGRLVATEDSRGLRNESVYADSPDPQWRWRSGDLIRSLVWDIHDKSGSTRLLSRTDFEYDDQGRQVLSRSYHTVYSKSDFASDGTQATTRITPDGVVPIVQNITHALVNKTQYDTAGRVWKTWEYQEDAGATQSSANPYLTINTYDYLGRLTKVTDRYGRDTRYYYDRVGNVVQTVYPDGSFTRTIYDINNRPMLTQREYTPVSSTPTIGDFEVSDSSASITVYDGFGRVFHTETVLKVLLKLVVDGSTDFYRVDQDSVSQVDFSQEFTRIHRVDTAYDAMDAVVTTTEYVGKVATTAYYQQVLHETSNQGGKTTRTTWSGMIPDTQPSQTLSELPGVERVSLETFDSAGRRLSSSSLFRPIGSTSTSAPLEAVTEYDYTLESTTSPNVQSLKLPEVTRLDTAGNSIASVRPTVKYLYQDGQRIGVVDQNGAVTAQSYDVLGRLVQVSTPVPGGSAITKYRYDDAGNRIWTQDALGRITFDLYDSFGLRIEHQSPDDQDGAAGANNNGKETWAYDLPPASGTAWTQQITYTDIAANQTKQSFDTRGRLAKDEPQFGSGVAATDPLRIQNPTYIYRYVRVSSLPSWIPSGLGSSGLRREIEEQQNDSGLATLPNPLTRIRLSRFFEDGAGRVRAKSTAEGLLLYDYGYDAAYANSLDGRGRLGGVRAFNARYSDSGGPSTASENDNLTDATAFSALPAADLNNAYVWDHRGRLKTLHDSGRVQVTVTGAGITGSPLAIPVSVSVYDSAATVAGKIRATLAANAAIASLYDVGGSSTSVALTRKTAAANDSTLNIAINGSIDSTGIPDAPTSANTTPGALPSTRQVETATVSGVSVSDTGTDTKYTYELGRLVAMRYPNQVATLYRYDTLGDVEHIRFVQDGSGTISSSQAWAYVSSATPPGGSPFFTYKRDFTGRRRLTQDQIPNTASTTLQREFRHTYDSGGRLATEVASSSLTTTTPSAAGASVSYGIDPVGNRTKRTVATYATDPGYSGKVAQVDSYNYDNQDKVTGFTGNTTLAWDSGGNVSNTGTGYTYTHDRRNRLRQSTLGTATASIAYDPEGIRVKKTVGTTTTLYLVDSMNPTGYPQVLCEYQYTGNGTPSIQRSYTYGLDLISDKQGTTRQYYSVDALGTTRFLTSSGATASLSASISAQFHYDAFGTLLGPGTDTSTPYLYTGEQWDRDVGAYYLRARWYSVGLGRFLERDSYGGSDSDPVSRNRYVYASADPIDGSDPSGYSTLAARYGQIVHKSIAEDFRRKNPTLGVSGPGVVRILESTGIKLDVIARLFPDLTILPPVKAIFEIKPAGFGQIAFGVAQLKGYIDFMNEFDPTKGWHAGTSAEYTPPLTVPIDAMNFAIVARPVHGVIVYKVFSISIYAKRMALNSTASQNAELQQRTGLASMLSSMGGF